MTNDEIMDIADECGLAGYFELDGDSVGELMVTAFAKLVADAATAKEREACAVICHDEAWKYKVLAVDKQKVDLNNKAIACFDLSEKIRARGKA